ncbi:hypothetical protein GJU40_07795 [Bacillus lacus]|uniref:Galactosyldiacylglycerol synthase n=1 Tax=Metabacillus lacus TaxID=1983721 RepID=A0A7X2IZL6_9BACI|nr:glycosyltransferase [Metabacillus lacus]MRX72073.1 hypothetical protein [Metabacillus lacus]
MKILFLPLFHMQSGHHKSSDVLMAAFEKEYPQATCEKVEFLSYCSPLMESAVSQGYVSFIKAVPKGYSKFYKQFFKQESLLLKLFYEMLFIEKMEQLLQRKKPDIIVCTHSFPSFLVDKLKKNGLCNVPVVNVYTDFFVNSLWGAESADFHLAPSTECRDLLASKGICFSKILVTGIPVAEQLKKKKQIWRKNDEVHVLIAGGSLGLGSLASFLDTRRGQHGVKYKILCGSNQKLYQTVANLNRADITPLSYVRCPKRMNDLYDWADAIITKPGGVTISEAMRKSVPIFIHSVLPGQEENNLSYLTQHGLAHKLSPFLPWEEQILEQLMDPAYLFTYNRSRLKYFQTLDIQSPGEAVNKIYSSLFHSASKKDQYLNRIFSKIYSSL